MASSPHSQYVVQTISARDTLQLREQVLWPGRPDMCPVSGDEAALHFGAIIGSKEDGKVIGVLSLFNAEAPGGRAQFRKLAVTPSWQGAGVGTCLVRRATDAAREAGAGCLFCHARFAQAGFYERLGFSQRGKAFPKYGGDEYVEMEMSLVAEGSTQDSGNEDAPIDVVMVTIESMTGDVVYGPAPHSRAALLKDLFDVLVAREGSEPVFLLGGTKMEDQNVKLESLMLSEAIEKPHLTFSVVWQEEKVPRILVVSGAGQAACNGIYQLTEQQKANRPIWRNETTGAWIEWWGKGCGWEMYHAPSGICDYWTQQDEDDQSLPHERPFKERGALAPAPTVSRQFVSSS